MMQMMEKMEKPEFHKEIDASDCRVGTTVVCFSVNKLIVCLRFGFTLDSN